MISLLLKIKKFYLTLKKKYYSIVIIEPKHIYFRHQKISYKEQNILGLIQNTFSTVWLLLLFSLLFKDIIYIYLTFFILAFGILMYLLITYFADFVPKFFLEVLLSLSYFYKSESEISNIFIYLFFLILLLLNISFGIKTYIFIRFLFFFRCFLSFVYFFYESFPMMQINILKKNLILDLNLLNLLHPMESIELEKLIRLQLENNGIGENDANNILNRYETLKIKDIKTVNIPYEREIINDKIVVYEYHNIAQSLNNMLDHLENDARLGKFKG